MFIKCLFMSIRKDLSVYPLPGFLFCVCECVCVCVCVFLLCTAFLYFEFLHVCIIAKLSPILQ